MDAAHEKMLRDAFAATMTDPDFVADAQKAKLVVAAKDGTYLLNIVKSMSATPRPLLDKIESIVKE